MDYSYFIGIDVSKTKLDVAIMNDEAKFTQQSCVTANEAVSFRSFISELEKKLGDLSQVLFCLEPTGHYSNVAVAELLDKGLSVWLANPVDIQRSIGMTRGKNDKVDSCRIAEYALRFADKANFVSARDLQAQQLRELLSQREMYVTTKASYMKQIKDFKGYISEQSYQTISELNLQIIDGLIEAIATIEQKIEAIIWSDQEFTRQYDLLQSIPGVGKVLSQTLIASTAGFERFNNPRALACHAGIAPFVYTSGSSVKSKSRVSHRANKRLKSLLHMAALCCIRIKGELREYYLRKVSEGKSKMAVINALRNKVLHRVFAVIMRNSPYYNLVIS